MSQRPAEATEVQEGDPGSADSAETQTRWRMFQAFLQASCSEAWHQIIIYFV